MKNTICICIIFLTVLTSMSCDNSSSDNNKPASNTEIEGTWVGTETAGNGDTIKFIMQGNVISIYEGAVLSYKGTFTNDTASNPKEIEITITDTDSQFSAYVGTVSLGIYKIESDTLTICLAKPGSGSIPASFTTTGVCRLFVLNKQ